MRKWFRSLTNSSEDADSPARHEDAPADPTASSASEGNDTRHGKTLGDLVQWVCARDNDLRKPNIDITADLCDAGYLDSMRGAELIAYLESRYSVTITEADFVGRMSTLERLATHVDSASPKTDD